MNTTKLSLVAVLAIALAAVVACSSSSGGNGGGGGNNPLTKTSTGTGHHSSSGAMSTTSHTGDAGPTACTVTPDASIFNSCGATGGHCPTAGHSLTTIAITYPGWDGGAQLPAP